MEANVDKLEIFRWRGYKGIGIRGPSPQHQQKNTLKLAHDLVPMFNGLDYRAAHEGLGYSYIIKGFGRGKTICCSIQ